MKENDVVVAPIPQADGMTKNRPVVVLREMRPYRDLLVCGISTQLHHEVENFDEMIAAEDDDFSSSGLVSESLIRLGFLVTLPRNRVLGRIGEISPERHERLLRRLSDYLTE